MMKLVPCLFLLLGSCMVVRRPAEPNPGAEVVSELEVMYDDLSSRRWEALETHFLPEASLIFSTQAGPKRMTAPAFIEMVRKNVEGKAVFEERMAACTVRAHGDLAFAWSSFEGKEGNEGDVRTWSGVDAFTLLRVEGRWKISHIAVSLDRPEER